MYNCTKKLHFIFAENKKLHFIFAENKKNMYVYYFNVPWVGKSIETKTDQGHDMTPREAIDIKQLHLINFDKYHN